MKGHVNYKEELLEINLTPNFGGFVPEHLVYFKNIVQIDISGCTEIIATLFVDCIATCRNLRIFSMTGCIQFSEKNMQKIFNQLPELEQIDCTSCADVTFATAYNIISPLKKLLGINLEPKFARAEYEDWKRLVQIFRFVTFGHSIMRIFPHYGMYVRFGLDQESDE